MPVLTRGRWRILSERTVAVVGAVVAAIALSGSAILQYSRVERYRSLADHLASLSRDAAELHTLGWRALAEQAASDEFIARMRDVRARFLAGQRTLALDSEIPSMLTQATSYEAYVAAVDRVELLVASGDLAQARAEADVAEAAYARLDTVVRDAENVVLARELRGLRSIQVGTFIVLLLGAMGAVFVRLRVLASLARSEERFRALSEHATDLLWVADASGRILYRTQSVEQMLGTATPGELEGTFWATVWPEDLERARAFISCLVQNPGTVHTFEGRFLSRDSRDLHLEVFGHDLTSDPNVGGIVLNARNVTERKEHEETLRRDALHDSLTHLPNRVLLVDRLTAALAASGHDSELTLAVVFIDLDGFKDINDTMGHTTGDALLASVAARLQSTLRILGRGVASGVGGVRHPPGTDTLARVGGDEFVVLLNHTQSAANALAAANRLLSALNRPFEVGEHKLHVSGSLGLAIGPAGYGSADELLRDADIAMYRAKALGGSQVQLFHPAMHEEATRRLRLRAQLRKAIDEQEFVLRYQPIVSLDTGELRACESLLRWRLNGATIPPADFIPLAEETGLIVPLGRWAMLEACRQARAWRTEFPGLPPGLLSINLSARELMHAEFITGLDDAVDTSGVDPTDITLELTESVAMQDPARAIAIIAQLHERGHRVAMDDFGTGHCSLSYFHQLSVDVLKIDRSFVRDIETSPRALAAVTLIVEMAKSVGMDVIAEGVETDEQAALLRRLGCARAQGYVFSGPLDPATLRERFLVGASDAPRPSAAPPRSVLPTAYTKALEELDGGAVESRSIRRR